MNTLDRALAPKENQPLKSYGNGPKDRFKK